MTNPQPCVTLPDSSIFITIPFNPLRSCADIRGWISRGSTTTIPVVDELLPLADQGSPCGLTSTRYTWQGLQSNFGRGEINYIRSLDLKDPLLIQDTFMISEDDDDEPSRPSEAVCILFRDIMLLCRE